MIHLNMSFFVNPRQGQMLNGISDSVQLHACSARVRMETSDRFSTTFRPLLPHLPDLPPGTPLLDQI